MHRFAGLALLAVTLAPVAIACAGGSTLPPAPTCTTPTATPAPHGNVQADQRYVQAFQSGAAQLKRLTDNWRAAWPDGRFSSRAAFRGEFVAYAAASRCLVDDLAAFAPANSAKYGEFDARAEGALAQYRDAIDYGLAAVRRRNVSEYREFYQRMDAAFARLDETVRTAPTP